MLLALALAVAASGRMVHTQGARAIAWDETSTVTGFAITVDGVRSDVGVTPLAADGSCGCAVPAWFVGARHQVIISAYNASGETSAPPFIVGPTASAGGPYTGAAGAPVSVTGAGSIDATGTITRYDWTWGDGTGSSSAGAATSHTYATAGTYTITVTVTDTDGANHAATATATIAPLSAPPSVPGTPTPATGASAISIATSLTWSASAATSYDVYFGPTTPPPSVSASQAAASYTPPAALAPSTAYFWQIVARNSQGTTAGPVWTFTTAAASASGGLVAAYAFAEGTGTTTADASGSGNTGVLNGPTWTTGKNGGALAFNGASTYVDLGNLAPLRLTGSMTLSAWVYETANVGDDGQIVAKSDGAAGWQLKSTPDTGVRTFAVAITNASGSMIHRYGKTVRALNTWYHVTGVYDAAALTLNLYVNGVLDNGTLVGTVPASQRDASVSANVGRRTGGFNLAGIVDDVRVYGRALTAADVQADMTTPVAGGRPAPATPGAPTPSTGATNVNPGTALTWTAAGATSYDVAFGTTNPPPAVTTGQTAASYTPALANGTTYFWRIVARNGQGATTGPVWTFTTGAASPATPSVPTPATGATNVSTGTSLTWTAAGATSYDVAFGTANPPPVVATGQAAASYKPSTALANSTTYFWRIVARNGQGATTGPVWTFTTGAAAPATPSAPTPTTGATNVSTGISLTWTATGATSYDVAFGTANPPPVVTTGQTAASYKPSTALANSTTYFWRIVARNSQGAATGPVWTFTTAAATSASGPLAAYGFSEGSGTAAADSSGHGITGLLVNSSWATGKNGSAVSFNGSTSYLDLGNPASLRLTGSMTVSAWVYETANVGDDGQIIAKSDGSGWQLKSTPDTGARTFAIAVANPSGALIQRYSKTVRALNTWYYVAGVYDATAKTLNIYVNSVLDNGALAGAVPSSQRDAPVNVNLGQRSGGFNLAGRVDNVRVYNRAQTQTELQGDMTTPVQ